MGRAFTASIRALALPAPLTRLTPLRPGARLTRLTRLRPGARLTRLALLALLALGACGEHGAADPGAGDGTAGTSDTDGILGDAAAPVDLDAAAMAIDPAEPLDVSGLPYRCEVGVPDRVTELAFESLTAGDPIPIGGSGQAGLVARTALLLEGGGDALPEVLVDLRLTNVSDGTVGESSIAGRPRRLDCGADGRCQLVPVFVEISHLAKLPQLEGLQVRIDVSVRETGESGRLLCRARNHGVLART